MCCLPGFVVPFIGHRQSGFSVILKAPAFSEWSKSIGFSLKAPDALTPKKRVSFSLKLALTEAKHWLFVFSHESSRWHLLPIESCFVYIENLLPSIPVCVCVWYVCIHKIFYPPELPCLALNCTSFFPSLMRSGELIEMHGCVMSFYIHP